MKENLSLGQKPLLAMLPPVNDDMRSWAERLVKDVPGLDVAVLEDDAAVREVLADVDAAYGWVSPSMLPLAQNLRFFGGWRTC